MKRHALPSDCPEQNDNAIRQWKLWSCSKVSQRTSNANGIATRRNWLPFSTQLRHWADSGMRLSGLYYTSELSSTDSHTTWTILCALLPLRQNYLIISSKDTTTLMRTESLRMMRRGRTDQLHLQ